MNARRLFPLFLVLLLALAGGYAARAWLGGAALPACEVLPTVAEAEQLMAGREAELREIEALAVSVNLDEGAAPGAPSFSSPTPLPPTAQRSRLCSMAVSLASPIGSSTSERRKWAAWRGKSGTTLTPPRQAQLTFSSGKPTTR